MKLKWFKKKEKQNKEETATTMSTLDEVKKAYADLSEEDKKSFHQSIKDRVDESVGEQEHLDGTKDSQTAKDRVDEAEGEEKAIEEKKAEEKSEERKDERDEKSDGGFKEEVFKRLDAIQAQVDALAKKPREATKDESDELTKATKWN